MLFQLRWGIYKYGVLGVIFLKFSSSGKLNTKYGGSSKKQCNALIMPSCCPGDSRLCYPGILLKPTAGEIR